MKLYVTEFDNNGNLGIPEIITVRNLTFDSKDNNFIILLENKEIYSYPILEPLSEIDYPGMKQEGYDLKNTNVKSHIKFLNDLMKNMPEAFELIGLTFSNSNIRKSLRVDIYLKNDYLSKINFPNFPNPIKLK